MNSGLLMRQICGAVNENKLERNPTLKQIIPYWRDRINSLFPSSGLSEVRQTDCPVALRFSFHVRSK